MDELLLSPCGTYCGPCEFLNREEKPSCLGCGYQKGQPFWGECKVYACSKEREVSHCGECPEFPCEVFVNQFDPSHGQRSSFTRAGLLIYRKKVGAEKFIDMVKKIEEEQKSKPNSS